MTMEDIQVLLSHYLDKQRTTNSRRQDQKALIDRTLLKRVLGSKKYNTDPSEICSTLNQFLFLLITSYTLENQI